MNSYKYIIMHEKNGSPVIVPIGASPVVSLSFSVIPVRPRGA